MKNILLLAAAICCMVNAHAQQALYPAQKIEPEAKTESSVVQDSQDPKYVYAQIMGTQKFLSTKVTISVDFGQSRGFFSDTRLRDEKTGQVQSFNSMVDALNYMANDGWEVVQAYAITVAQQNVYHYLLRRKR